MDIAQNIIYLFDLFGTIIFAITGAVKGVRCKLDFLGVIVFACTVGCGGGMLRDVLIGCTPVAAFSNGAYITVSALTGLVVFFCAPKIANRWNVIVYCDALGLGVFTAIGVAKGAQYGIGPVGQLLCGVFTAVGGGVVRDIMSKSVPVVLTSDFYATASLAGGLLYLLLEKNPLPLFANFLICTVTVVALRILAVANHIHLPVANVRLPDEDDWRLFHGHSRREQHGN